jgi:hypothetical protein
MLGMDVYLRLCLYCPIYVEALRQPDSPVCGALLNAFNYDSGTRKSRQYCIAVVYRAGEGEEQANDRKLYKIA